MKIWDSVYVYYSHVTIVWNTRETGGMDELVQNQKI